MEDRTLIMESPPEDFSPRVEVAGVLCFHAGRTLFLQRGPTIPHPLLWNIPGGKVDAGETSVAAAVRELEEESGVSLDPDQLLTFGTIYIRRWDGDFSFHLFHTELESEPELSLDPIESIASCWVTLEEALSLPLISGDVEIINLIRRQLDK